MDKIIYVVGAIGIGHTKRSEPVIKESRARGNEIHLLADERAYDYFNNSNLSDCLGPKLTHFTFAGGDYNPEIAKSVLSCLNPFNKKSLLRCFFAQYREVRDYMRSIEGGPDVVVADGNITALRAASYNFPKVKRVYLANFTRVPLGNAPPVEIAINGYLKWRFHNCKIVVPDIPKPKAICDYLVKEHQNIEWVGPLQEMRESSKRGEDILAPITNHELARDVLDALKDYDRNCLITLGDKINTVAEQKGNASLVNWMEVFDYDAYSLVVTKAGHRSIWDNIANRKPMVVIASKGHSEEMANAHKVRDMDLGEIIYGDELYKLPKKIEKVLKNYNYHQQQVSNLNNIAAKYREENNDAVNWIANIIEN